MDSFLTQDTGFVLSPPSSSPIPFPPLPPSSPQEALASSSQKSKKSFTPLPPSSSQEASSSSSQRAKKSRRDAKFDSAVNAIVASATQIETETVFSSFAKTLALQLQQLPLADATETMSEIHSHVTMKLLAHMKSSKTAAQQPNVSEIALRDDAAESYGNFF